MDNEVTFSLSYEQLTGLRTFSLSFDKRRTHALLS